MSLSGVYRRSPVVLRAGTSRGVERLDASRELMPQFSVSLASLGSRTPAILFGASTSRPERATLVVGND